MRLSCAISGWRWKLVELFMGVTLYLFYAVMHLLHDPIHRLVSWNLAAFHIMSWDLCIREQQSRHSSYSRFLCLTFGTTSDNILFGHVAKSDLEGSILTWT